MPSPLFEVKLRPDPLLHRAVLLAGVIAMVIGALIIIDLRLHFLWRCTAGAIWLLDCLFEIRRLLAGEAWVRQVSLDSGGGVTVLDVAGDRVPLTLQSGSIVLRELAWLRVANENGRYYAGLFARRRMDDLEWHRLQLLWQQSRKAFGHRPGP